MLLSERQKHTREKEIQVLRTSYRKVLIGVLGFRFSVFAYVTEADVTHRIIYLLIHLLGSKTYHHIYSRDEHVTITLRQQNIQF